MNQPIKIIQVVIDEGGNIIQQTIEFNPHHVIYHKIKLTIQLKLNQSKVTTLTEQLLNIPVKYRKSITVNQQYIDNLIQKSITEYKPQ